MPIISIIFTNYAYICEIMNDIITWNNIFLFFAQGAYFLLIAIFACKLLRQYRVHIKLLTGILLSVWVMLNVKDLIIYHTQANSDIERVNWITMIDQLAIPIIGIAMFELTRPRSITTLKVALHFLPFVIMLTLYCITHSHTCIIITIIIASLYSVFIITATLLRLREIPQQNPEHKAIFNITHSFLFAISIWILSCIFPSALFDMIYYIVSGIAWYIIYYSIENTYPLNTLANTPIEDNNRNINTEIISETDTIHKEYPFALALNSLFEQDLIYLNPELTLSDVARSIGTNRSYLSEYFNHECNTSFNDYINNLRLSYAENIMTTNQDISIEEIASTSGFNSISTFRRAFIKKHGVTPSNYRHEHLCSAK